MNASMLFVPGTSPERYVKAQAGVAGALIGVSTVRPSMPKVPDPIKPPTTDDARQAEEDIGKLRRRRGCCS